MGVLKVGAGRAQEALCACLRDSSELGMVRHEAAEALGSIADEDTVEVLKPHAGSVALCHV